MKTNDELVKISIKRRGRKGRDLRGILKVPCDGVNVCFRVGNNFHVSDLTAGQLVVTVLAEFLEACIHVLGNSPFSYYLPDDHGGKIDNTILWK